LQFNTAARQLVELDKPSDSDGGAEGPAAHGGGAPRGGGGGEKKNTKKRHSFTSLTMSHKPSLAPPPQRHSMEISGPVLISSSNPTAAARIGELSGGLSCSAPSQVRHAPFPLLPPPAAETHPYQLRHSRPAGETRPYWQDTPIWWDTAPFCNTHPPSVETQPISG